jgi:hypothetical protein
MLAGNGGEGVVANAAAIIGVASRRAPNLDV